MKGTKTRSRSKKKKKDRSHARSKKRKRSKSKEDKEEEIKLITEETKATKSSDIQAQIQPSELTAKPKSADNTPCSMPTLEMLSESAALAPDSIETTTVDEDYVPTDDGNDDEPEPEPEPEIVKPRRKRPKRTNLIRVKEYVKGSRRDLGIAPKRKKKHNMETRDSDTTSVSIAPNYEAAGIITPVSVSISPCAQVSNHVRVLNFADPARQKCPIIQHSAEAVPQTDSRNSSIMDVERVGSRPSELQLSESLRSLQEVSNSMSFDCGNNSIEAYSVSAMDTTVSMQTADVEVIPQVHTQDMPYTSAQNFSPSDAYQGSMQPNCIVNQLGSVTSADQLDNSASVNHLDNFAPVNQMDNSVSANQLDNSTSVNQLDNSASINQLNNSASINQLDNSASINQLNNSASINQLDNSASINQLDNSASINQLDNSASVNQLDSAPAFLRSDLSLTPARAGPACVPDLQPVHSGTAPVMSTCVSGTTSVDGVPNAGDKGSYESPPATSCNTNVSECGENSSTLLESSNLDQSVDQTVDVFSAPADLPRTSPPFGGLPACGFPQSDNIVSSECIPTPVALLSKSQIGLHRLTNLEKRFGACHKTNPIAHELVKDNDNVVRCHGKEMSDEVAQEVRYSHPLPGTLSRTVPVTPAKSGTTVVVTPKKSGQNTPQTCRQHLLTSPVPKNVEVVANPEKHVSFTIPQEVEPFRSRSPQKYSDSRGTLPGSCQASRTQSLPPYDGVFVVPNKDTIVPSTPSKLTRKHTTPKKRDFFSSGQRTTSPFKSIPTTDNSNAAINTDSQNELSSNSLPLKDRRLRHDDVQQSHKDTTSPSRSTHVSTSRFSPTSRHRSPTYPPSVSPKRSAALDIVSALAKQALDLQQQVGGLEDAGGGRGVLKMSI